MMRAFFIEHKKAFQTKAYKLGKIFKLSKSFNFYYVLRILCTFNIAVAGNEMNIRIQDIILSMLLNKKDYRGIVNELNSLAKRQGEPFVVFHRQQFLFLIKTILLYGDPNNKTFYKDTKNKLGKVLTSINAYLGKREPRFEETDEEKVERLSKDLVPISFFASTGNYHGSSIIYRFARTITMWNTIYLQLKASGAIKYDYDADFKMLTNLSFIEYLYILFAIYLHFMNIDVENAEADRYFFNEKSYFSHSNLNAVDVGRVIDTCRLVPTTFEQSYKKIVDDFLGGKDNYSLNFVVFQDKPLLELESGQIFPIDLGYFADKVREGIYWELNNSYGDKDLDKAKKDYLPHMMGMIFEEYIKLILLSAFGSKFTPLPAGVASQAEGTILIDLPNRKKCLVVIEVKHIRLKLQTILKRDLNASLNDFKKVLGNKDGLGQIYSTIVQIFNGTLTIPDLNVTDIDTIIPLIITSEFMPDDPFSRKFYEDNFINDQKKQLPDSIQAILLEPYLISADEMEMIESMVLTKGDNKLVEFFHERNKVITKKNIYGFHEMLGSVRDDMIKKGYSYRNGRLDTIFKNFAKELRIHLFNNPKIST